METSIKEKRVLLTKEQKLKIVSEIESCQIDRKEASTKYNICGKTINTWIVQYGSSDDLVGKKYSQSERRHAAYKVITGEITTQHAARQLKVSPGTVMGWVGKFRNDIPNQNRKVDIQPEASPSSLQVDQKEIQELKIKVAALEMMVDIAERELKIEIRKKFGTKL